VSAQPEELRCLEDNTVECSGPVEYRDPLSGTGKSFPRCASHWAKRLEKQEEIVRKYAPFSDVPPAGFDPTYAGERWDDEY
jgi:hypothetical protein